VTLLVVKATLRLQGKDKEAEGRPCFRQMNLFLSLSAD